LRCEKNLSFTLLKGRGHRRSGGRLGGEKKKARVFGAKSGLYEHLPFSRKREEWLSYEGREVRKRRFTMRGMEAILTERGGKA